MSQSQSSFHQALDLDVDVPFGSIWFSHRYHSLEEMFSSSNESKANCLQNVPVPFGRFAADNATHHTGIRWMPNTFSFVCSWGSTGTTWIGGNPPFSATDIWGGRSRFETCASPPCVAKMTRGEDKTSRMLKLDAGWLLVDDTGMRTYYQDRYISDAGEYGANMVYFLTRLVDAEGNVVAAATYKNPKRPDGGLCTEGVGSDAGIPYLERLVSPHTGAGLSFGWTELPRPDLSGARDCVLSQVRVLHSDGGTGQVVDYTYRNNKTGYLETVTGGMSPESYDYDGGFGVKQLGVYTSFHPFGLDQNDVQVTTGARIAGPAFNMTWQLAAQQGLCAPDTCCNWIWDRSWHRNAAYTNARVGDFSGGNAQFTRAYTHTKIGEQWYQYPLVATRDSCTPITSCSPGEEYHAWRSVRGQSGPAYCGSSHPSRETGYRNKLGNWFIDGLAYVCADAGPWAHCAPGGEPIAGIDSMWERRLLLRGVAPSITSNNPLEVRSRSYGYTTDVSAQKLVAEEAPSVIQPGADAGTYYRYSAGTAHLEAVYRSGYTKDTNGNIQSRTVATFYRTVRPSDMGTDALGRVVAIEGPCDVNGTGANACTSSPAPLTELFYFAANTGDDNAGRLVGVKQYPAGTTSTPLITVYGSYTPAGDPKWSIGPNLLVTTTYTYNDAREMTSKNVNGNVTYYSWENHRLTSIQHPQLNIERFCYRSGTNCDGTWLRNLQWQAKYDSSSSSWSEKIVYSYWPNDSLESMTFYTNNGGEELRRQEWFDEDAQQRPTAHRTGDGTGSFTSKKSWDGANNLAAIGPSFNGAPDFCKTGSALDDRCAWLKYDRANRLSEFDAHPAGTAGPGLRTCFDHDVKGNVRRVSMGCLTDAGTACNMDGGMSTCSAAPNDYTYDDFGNVIEAKLANSDDGSGARGWIRYLHDAFGNVTYELRSSSLTNSFSYDQLGRLLTVTGYPYEAFTLSYDDASVVPGTCGTVENTMGRLVMRTDAYWKTYYSYDAEGRVVREARHSATSSGCPTPALDTVYTYSPNGNLTSIRYPHGRTVTYTYPSSGAALDRVSSISMTTHNGTSFSSTPGSTVIDSVAWEPYGGLRSYVAQHATSSNGSRIEYMRGGDSSAGPGSGAECADSSPSVTSGYDKTGRLRSLRVSFNSTSSLGSGNGELFKRLYTWKADQVTRMDTCYLDDDLPLTESIGATGYDATLRLKSVTMPSHGTTGGWQTGQTYLYDARGNKTKVYVDVYGNNYDLQYSTAAHRPDLLVKENSGGLAHDFYNDNDGFVYAISSPNKSPTELGSYFYFNRRAAGTYSNVWFTDMVTSKAYVYNYDVFNRRVRKGWPADTSDWFFYDTGHQMLEDLGVSTTVYPGSPYPIDEYIWLDGRAVAVVRAKLDASLARSADGSGTCTRNGQPAACDTYFIVTDHIGKPVLSLDSSRRITGVGEYEPFGAINRGEAWWGTDWTYGPGAGDSPLVLQQRSHGMTTAFRAHFNRFEAEEAGCGGGFLDGIQTFDNTTSTSCGQYTGHLGETWTAWCPTVQNGSGYSQYKLNWHTDATNCAPGCWLPPCDPGTYAGFTLRDYEYQRYQAGAGASMYFPPLRFPGQYYDEETHLHENWNRTYGPVMGRYLQPEPILRSPRAQVAYAKMGHSLPVYSYALNNPNAFVDPNGKNPALIALPVGIAIGEALVWTGVFSAGVYCIGTRCLGDLNNWLSAVSNPFHGTPNTCSTNPGSGQIRGYGADGRPSFDIDYDHDHGQGVPHWHDWGDGVRGTGQSFDPSGVDAWENEGGSLKPGKK